MENLKYHKSKESIEEENTLIIDAQNDVARFDILYKKYYKSILLFVYQRVDTKNEALDVTSQVFLKAISNLKKYQFRGLPFSAWLYRIALNEINKAFKQNSAHRAVNIDLENSTEIIQEINATDFDKEIALNKLADILIELPEKERLIIELRFFEKKHFKEIGEILDITENNAKMKLYRIIDKIKQLF